VTSGPPPGTFRARPADQRPVDSTPVHTAELPPLPTRDRNIPASAWVEAPTAVLEVASRHGLDTGDAMYKREINGWLLWRSGPAKGDAVYVAVRRHDLTRTFEFVLRAGGDSGGAGPDGRPHDRFRSWKEALRDHS